MSRPEFPNCVMTPEIISAISREQEYYDQDPQRYERQQQAELERRQQEEEAYYWESVAIENQIQQSENRDQIEKDSNPENNIDDLPF